MFQEETKWKMNYEGMLISLLTENLVHLNIILSGKHDYQ